MPIAQNHTAHEVNRLIVDAYFQAICAAKMVKNLQGADAQRAACRAVAAVVSKHTGQTITDAVVHEIVRHAPGRTITHTKRTPGANGPTTKTWRWWLT